METEIQTVHDLLPLTLLAEYPQLPIAIRYLLLRDDPEHLQMGQILETLQDEFPDMPKTISGMYGRVEQWRRDGTLDKANEIVVAPKIEELRAAVYRVITAMPKMLDKLVDDVLSGTAKSKTLEHVMYLYQEIVKPEMATQEEPGAKEKRFLERTTNFNPLDIEEV